MKCVQLSWTFRLLKVQFEGILSLCDNVGVGRWRYFNENYFILVLFHIKKVA